MRPLSQCEHFRVGEPRAQFHGSPWEPHFEEFPSTEGLGEEGAQQRVSLSHGTLELMGLGVIQSKLLTLKGRREGGRARPRPSGSARKQPCLSPLLPEEVGRAGCSAGGELMRAQAVSVLCSQA